MLPKVFEIDEILRPIASHVIDIDGSSAIALACCCRVLEEPVLSLYWKDQSLDDLAAVLPTSVLKRSGTTKFPYYTIVRHPTREERDRLLRYAFWIRRITAIITRRLEPFLQILQSCSPDSTPFPNLRGLQCSIYPSFLRYLPYFISPQTIAFAVTVHPDVSFDLKEMERDHLAAAVRALPPFLREFALCVDSTGLGSDELKEEVLLMVRRCGPILTSLEIDVELPPVVVHHAMKLPDLRTWRVHGDVLPVPYAPPSQISAYLPALRSLALAATNTYDWIVFLASSHPALSRVRSTLTKLNLSGCHAVDPVLIDQICAFRNLTHLDIGCSCSSDRCSFSLTDSDLSNLSLALPRLERLMLGHQCDKNTCTTTFRSLLFLSARCPSLAFLSVHFNTIQLAQDIQSLFETEDRCIKELRDGPTRCQISTFSVAQTPLSLAGMEELDVLKRGFLNIFPQLTGIARKYGRAWQCLTEALRKQR